MNDSKKLLVRYITIITDLVTMFAVYLVANWIKFGNFRTGIYNPADSYLGLFTTALMCYLLVTFLLFSGDDLLSRNCFKEIVTVVQMQIYIAALTIGYLFITKSSWYYSRGQMIMFFGGSVVMVVIVRQVLKRIILKSYHRSGANEKILLVTTYDEVPGIIRKVKRTRNWYFRISNLAIVDRNVIGEEIEGFEVVANKDNLLEWVSTAEIDTVFFHITDNEQRNYTDLIQKIRTMGKNVRVRIREYSYDHGNRRLEFLGEFAVVNFSTKKYRFRHLAIKRLFDIIVGIIGSIFYAILFVLVSISLALEGEAGHAVMSTVKVGKNGRRFYFLRFRTLSKKSFENQGVDGVYVYTRTGKVLRALGLENIPNAWNVLWGNMSLVGVKAPSLSEFLAYPPERRKCLNMKPGVIGLSQIQNSKRYNVEKSDEYYLDNWSVWTDIKIILKTLGLIFTK